MLFKFCSQYVSKFGKLTSGHRTRKGQFSFQSQRKAMLKNVPTITQLCSFHILVRLCAKYFRLNFSSMWTENFRCPSWVLMRQKNQRSNCQHSLDHGENKGIPEKTSTSASLTTLKPLTLWITTNCEKFFKRQEYHTTLPISWETCTWVKK